MPREAAVLIHDRRDSQLPWQWWAPGPTTQHREFATNPRCATHTYIAGFATEADAREYGDRNGWPAEVAA